ncbi:MAG: PD40 domain-containing protein [Bacteroidetes bacterium]|nr:PD40 domain-containing protein [Bacteroidota bacterium]
MRKLFGILTFLPLFVIFYSCSDNDVNSSNEAPEVGKVSLAISLSEVLDKTGLNVDSVIVLFSGPQAARLSLTISADGLSASGEKLNLSVGTYQILVNIYAGGAIVASGTGQGTVESGKQTIVELTLQFLPGSIKIIVRWNTDAELLFIGKIGGSTNWELWKMNASNGSGKTKLLSFTESYVGGLSISPDKKRIAFFAGPDAAYNIFIANIDGSNKIKITSQTAQFLYYYLPKWINNSTLHVSIARNGDEGKRDVIKMNDDGSDIVYLTQTTTRSIGPLSLSGDGSKVVFSEGNPYASATTEIYIADYPSFSNKTLLTNPFNPGSEDVHGWFGDKIYLHGSNGTQTRILRINADGTGLEYFTPAGTTDEYNPKLSDDGQRITYISQSANVQNIYLMNNDGTGKIALTNNSSTADIITGVDWK